MVHNFLICLSLNPSVCMPVCMPVCLCVYQSNRSNVVTPVIDVINDNTLQYQYGAGTSRHQCRRL